ncbi:membrane protein [Caballeronia catudaia]|uniref:Membrane protein n=1 Tax=Caballeronia catudaia TaxID=1777136 RepID=A0A158D6J9_9BURK|nr:DUF4148 domain-containing protein [Caballeronia catudaia]SAK89417.1 membrane protein [Caballeronia catudaia]
MKQIFLTAALAVLASSPIASFAQTDAPVTRAQVRAELADLERAGYKPIPDDVEYPVRLQKAEARLQAEKTTSQRQAAIQSGTQQH